MLCMSMVVFLYVLLVRLVSVVDVFLNDWCIICGCRLRLVVSCRNFVLLVWVLVVMLWICFL